MFAKAKATLNSSENLQLGRIWRYAVSTSVFEKLQRPSKIHDSHTYSARLCTFIYGRQITLLRNKVTGGMGTKVFEARPRQSSRYSAFSKTYPLCMSYLRPSLLSFLPHHPLDVDRSHWGRSWTLSPSSYSLENPRSIEHTRTTASLCVASRRDAVGKNEATPLGARKKSPSMPYLPSASATIEAPLEPRWARANPFQRAY